MSEAKPVWTSASPTAGISVNGNPTATEAAHLRRMLEELDELLAEDAGLLLELAQAREGQRRLLAVALGRLRISLGP